MNTEWETRSLVSQSEDSKALLQKPTSIEHAPTPSIWFSGVIPLTVFTFLGCKKGQLELSRTLGIEIHVGNWIFYLFNLSIYFLL
jgi:hypothetical protein